MSEFFITARSFAAPFVSDTSDAYVEADSPRAALEQFASEYEHPAGLYAAEAWSNHRHFHVRGSEPLARYLSNKAAKTRELTTGGGHTVYSPDVGVIEIDGVRHAIEAPTEGRVQD